MALPPRAGMDDLDGRCLAHPLRLDSGGTGGQQLKERPRAPRAGVSHRRKGIIAASGKVLEASFRRRDHHSAAPALPCGHGTRMVARCDALPCCAVLRLGGVRGGAQTLSDTHYRTCIKGQGPDNIKIERKQFDRATLASGGDDHNAASRWSQESQDKSLETP
jgi:hypothetical protein